MEQNKLLVSDDYMQPGLPLVSERGGTREQYHKLQRRTHLSGGRSVLLKTLPTTRPL